MRFDIMTLFPGMVEAVLGESIIGRAQTAELVEVYTHQIRDYSNDIHRKVDDTPYGGGMGMLMTVQPVFDCYDAVKAMVDMPKTRTLYMSPQGKVFNQKTAERLAEYDRLIILCGHYEGVDQRIIDGIVDEEISIGDYVLTGGELAACVVCDAVSRLKDGVLASKECHENESISCGMLEYPQYTKPREYRGMEVPEVLLGGNHAAIDRWRYEAALAATMKKRPDLL